MKQFNIFGDIDFIEYDKEKDKYIIIKTMKEQIEWNILIALFKATVEQKSMLIGQSKQDAKVIFNRWLKDGNNLLKLIESNSSEDDLEEISFIIEQSINRLRKKKTLVKT